MPEKKELKTDLYNIAGEKTGQISLSPEIFGVELNKSLIAQAIKVYLANQRRGTAKAKTRSDVSGGGKKPWKQKGTGRARQGSTRSPIWSKGGVAHGPLPKDWSLKLSKKMRKIALFSSLSDKFRNQKIKFVESLDFKEIKTQKAYAVLNNLKMKENALIVLAAKKDNSYLSFRNLPRTEILIASQINTYTIYKHEYLLIEKDALDTFAQTFLNQEKKDN